MATKAEQFHATEQKKEQKNVEHTGRQKTKTPKRAARTATKTKRRKTAERAARKATYALEAPRPGRPSRKSTRKAANRAKPDTNLKLRDDRSKRSPESRYRKARARPARQRGSA